ncbi:hypothetical protein KKD61_00555 [Patescibacteria group bacterium]|nr:hypothetical protein [Patescibacteria group bacterium]
MLKIGSILTIVIWIISSWFLVHILAVLGVFLAVAYPIWWLFAPKQTVCFLCQTKKEGEFCPFCRKTVTKEEGILPKTLPSAIYNGLIILAFALVSLGLVFLESKILFKMGFPPTPKTVSFVIPTKGQYRLGEIFPMKIEIVGIKTPINAIQADLGFEPQKLEVVDISTEDSFANIFIQKEINNEVGYARLTGGLPHPGFFADHGVFGTVFFQGKSPGIAKVEFLPSSMVLANDGRGTDTLKDLASVSYLVLPERISKEEAEMQKSVIMKSVVLGETSEDTQMKFYEEKKILGAKVGEEIQEEKKFNLIRIFLDGLEKVDRFVLTLWEKVFSFFRQ